MGHARHSGKLVIDADEVKEGAGAEARELAFADGHIVDQGALKSGVWAG